MKVGLEVDVTLQQRMATKLTRYYDGEFDFDDQILSRINAQMQFLRAVHDHAHEVLVNLHNGPLECFRSAKLDETKPQLMPLYWFEVLSLGRNQSLMEAYEEHREFLKSKGYQINLDTEGFRLLAKRLQPLVTSLWKWSKDSGLDADWCRARAFFTLAHLSYSKAVGDVSKLDWSYDHPEPAIAFACEDFSFSWAWHPARTSRSEITRIIRERFSSELKEYLDETEQRFKLKKRLTKKRDETHFFWLVLVQIKRMSAREVVDQCFPERKPHGPLEYSSDTTKSVRKAINDLANFIDLPLREDAKRPGRRPIRTV